MGKGKERGVNQNLSMKGIRGEMEESWRKERRRGPGGGEFKEGGRAREREMGRVE